MGDSSDRSTVFSKDAFRYNTETDFLGAGAFGTVYRATIKSSGKFVAIKVLNTPAQLRDRDVDCLMKEVALLQRLSGCPNIIRLIGVCVNPRHYALVMEYVENGDLEDLLLNKRDDHPAIKQWDCRIRMGLDIARGMDFLHGQQPPIIHRDLKSANVLVDTNYCCKIIDFGLSKSRGISSCRSTLLQRSHQNVAGTMAFIAPERFKREAGISYPDKADVYSFSIVLWQLKEMRRPFEDEASPDAVRVNVVASIRPSFSHDDCPVELREFIPQCWRPQPQVRPHFSEIVTTLERILQSFVSQHSIVQQTRASGSTGRVAVNRKQPSAHGLPSHNTAGSPPNARSLVSQSAEHTNAATQAVDHILGPSVRSDELEVTSVLPPSKSRRLSYGEDSRRRIDLSVIPNDTSKWMRWPHLPVSGMFHNNCVAMDPNTLVVADTQQVYSLNTERPEPLPTCNWTVHNRFLGDGVVLHRLFTAGKSSFVTYYLNNSSDLKQRIARFDLHKKTWTDVCDLPSYQLLQNYSIVGDKHYAYIVGGENKTCNDVFDTVLKYDLSTGKQCERGNLISKRKKGSSAIVNNRLYVGGGSDGQKDINSMETITLSDFTGGSWRSTSTETYQCSLCDGGGSLIATGGLKNFSVSKEASVFCHDKVIWSLLPAMDEGRRCHGLYEVGSCVVAVGGADMAGSRLNSVESLSFVDIWRCQGISV